MQSNLRSLILAPVMLATAALATIPAMAGTVRTATIKVPFSFTVAGKTCPAGMYSVERDASGNFLKLKASDASQSFSWVAESSGNFGNRVTLDFDEVDAAHVLRSVQYGPVVTSRLDKKLKIAENTPTRSVQGQ